MVLRLGRSSFLFPEEIEVKTSQWVRHKASCWNYLLLIPKPFHRVIFLCFSQGYVIQKREKKPSLEPDKPAEDIYT